MKTIVVVGEILVEIMAVEPGQGFLEPLALAGPYPSGAPAIFIDQAARIGQPAAIVGCVGDDDFGRLNVARLQEAGVDVSAVRTDSERPTGSAFVRYAPDGSRAFVFNLAHSAAGRTAPDAAGRRVLDEADHLHVMGSSLFDADVIALNLEAARAIRARGGTVSFDPNVRREVLDRSGMRDAMAAMLGLTDLFLPSGEELRLLTGAATDEEAFAGLLAQGIKAIVHKAGKDGSTYHDAGLAFHVPAFAVEEVDPTGAGDCFGATFVALWLRDMAPREALTLASAAGALAVTRRGPMEGNASLADIERFIAAQRAPFKGRTSPP